MTEHRTKDLLKDSVSKDESNGKCQAICKYGLPCARPAKWLTPKTRGQFFRRKVCGVHKARFETLFAKATPL